MKINKLKIVLLLLFLVFVSVGSAFSLKENDSQEVYTSTFNWKSKMVTLEFTSKLDQIKKNRAQGFYFTESTSNLKIIHYLLKSILAVRVDSRNLLGNIPLSSDYLASLKSEIERIAQVNSRASKDLTSIKLSYKLPMFPSISSFLVNHTQASSFQNDLVWTPSEKYSGLVIYAAKPLKSHGEYSYKLLNPALFIKLYDEDINIVMEKEKMSPVFLKKWGSVAYTDDFNEENYINRIGRTPLRTIARGVFGSNYTDIILSHDTIARLWSSKSNSKILKEGRILVIISSEKINESLL